MQRKLTLAMLPLVLALLLIGTLGIWVVRQISSTAYGESLDARRIVALTPAAIDLKTASNMALQYASAHGAAAAKSYKQIEKNVTGLRKSEQAYLALPTDPRLTGSYMRFVQDQNVWMTGMQHLIDMVRAGAKPADVVAYFSTQIAPHGQAAASAVQQLERLEAVGAKVDSAHSQALANEIERVIILALIAGVVGALVATVLATRRVVAPLVAIGAAAERITEGDLTVNLGDFRGRGIFGGEDETHVVTRIIREMVDALRTTAFAVRTAADNVHSQGDILMDVVVSAEGGLSAVSESTGRTVAVSVEGQQSVRVVDDAIGQMREAIAQVASAAQDLAHDAAHGADIVAQAEQDIGTARQTVETLADASQRMRQAGAAGRQTIEDAIHGMHSLIDAVQHAAQTVAQLGDEAEKVSAIVETIREIAEQTNLLALNAAIEAARAGESGAGFAVVADEVRRLATRAQASTQEIAALMDGMLSIVRETAQATSQVAALGEAGRALSGSASEALEAILIDVESTDKSAHDFRHVMEQLLSGLKRLSDAVTATATVAEENAAQAEEMHASAESTSRALQGFRQLTEEVRARGEQSQRAAETVVHEAARVREVSRALSDASGKLDEAVERFRL